MVKNEGGRVERTGIVDADDFMFNQSTIAKLHKTELDAYNGSKIYPYSTDRIDNVFQKNNMFSGEPYLFFGKKDTITDQEKEHFEYLYYYYVAYNSGFGRNKKAEFKRYNIYGSNGTFTPTINISNILKDALQQLKYFLDEQRLSNPSFCNTIYTAVVEELASRQQQ